MRVEGEDGFEGGIVLGYSVQRGLDEGGAGYCFVGDGGVDGGDCEGGDVEVEVEIGVGGYRVHFHFFWIRLGDWAMY